MTRGPVLVGFDVTDGAEVALRQGRALAQALKRRLIVGHVVPEGFGARVLFPHQARIDVDEQACMERRATEAIRAHLTTMFGNAPEVALATGIPHSGLMSLAERFMAGVIVVGPGKVARRVARAAGLPVLVARPSPEHGAVLGATDFSDPALPAVRAAGEEAKRRQASLRLLHCLDVDPPLVLAHDGMFLSFPELSSTAFAGLEREAIARLRAALAEVGRAGEPVVVRQPATDGIVATALSTPTSLVVVGARGRIGLLGLVLGNVAEHVIRRAPCSVLVVPLRDGQPDDDSVTLLTA